MAAVVTLEMPRCEEFNGWIAVVDWRLSRRIFAILSFNSGNETDSSVGGCRYNFNRSANLQGATGYCDKSKYSTNPLYFRYHWCYEDKRQYYNDGDDKRLDEPFDVDEETRTEYWGERGLPHWDNYRTIRNGSITNSAMLFYDFLPVLENDGSWLGRNGFPDAAVMGEEIDIEAYIKDFNESKKDNNTTDEGQSIWRAYTENLDQTICPPCYEMTDEYGFWGRLCEAEFKFKYSRFEYMEMALHVQMRDIDLGVCEQTDINPWGKKIRKKTLRTFQKLDYGGSKPLHLVQWEWLSNYADNIGGSKQNYNWVYALNEEDTKQRLWLPDALGNEDATIPGKPYQVQFVYCDCAPGLLKCINSDGTFCCYDCCEDIAKPVVEALSFIL